MDLFSSLLEARRGAKLGQRSDFSAAWPRRFSNSNFFNNFCNDTLRRELRRQTGWMQCVFGGVAPAPLKDKRFWNFLRDGATFFVMISLLANCRNKPSICGHFSSLLEARCSAKLGPRNVFFAAWPRLFSNSSFFDTFCNDAS